MKALILCDVRWANASAWHAAQCARAMNDRGHEMAMLVDCNSPAATMASALGVEVIHSSMEKRGPFGIGIAASQLGQLVAERKIDLLDAHRSEGLLVARLARTGLAVVRSRGDIRPPRSGFASRALYRFANGHHLAGEFMRRDLDPLGVNPGLVRIISPALDRSRFDPTLTRSCGAILRQSLGDRPVIGLIARFAEVKGHQPFFRAMAAVPNATILVAGSNERFTGSDVEQWAAEAGISDRVIVETGKRDDVRELLGAIDVLAIPSRGSEAICRIAMEAMSASLPVVAMGVGILPETVESAGFVVTPEDWTGMARAIGELVDQPEARSRLGDLARRRSELFDRDRLGCEVEEGYAAAIENRRSGSGS